MYLFSSLRRHAGIQRHLMALYYCDLQMDKYDRNGWVNANASGIAKELLSE